MLPFSRCYGTEAGDISYWLNGVLISGLVAGSLLALVALGFNTVYRTTKLFNVAQGDLIMWAPMGTLVALQLWHLPVLPSLAIGICAPVGFALAAEVVAIRPFVARAGQPLWIISTLGVSMILQQVAAIPFQGQNESLTIGLSSLPLHVGPIRISPQQIVLLGGAIVATLAVQLLYQHTRLGQMLIAVGEDADGARALGISPARMSQWAIVISGLTAAIAGLSIAPLILVSPAFGFSLIFGGFVAAALGGIGSIGGGLIGGFFTGLLIQFSSAVGISEWSNATLFGAVLIAFLVRPTGFFGERTIRPV